jgi:hypothetical protein
MHDQSITAPSRSRLEEMLGRDFVPRPKGAGSIRLAVDRSGYLSLRSHYQIAGRRVAGPTIGVRRGNTEAEQRRNLQVAYREMERRLARAIAEATAPEAPPPAEVGPDGREYARINSPTFRRWIYARDNGLCGICGKPVAFGAMHIDHVIPRIDGGTDHVSNFRISHGPCNIRRGSERRRLIAV